MKRLKAFPWIQQAGMMECGTTCLAMIFKYYGYYDIRRFLTDQAEVNLEGTDLYTLSQLAQQFGFEADGYQMRFEDMLQVQLPFIAHYDGNHFVVVYKVTERKVWVADPATGKYQYSRGEFESKWNGIGLILEPTKELFKHNEITELVEANRAQSKSLFKKFYLTSLLGTSRRNLWAVLIGSIVIMLLELALPVFTQTIIDRVLVSENVKLLYAILVAIAVLFAGQVVLRHGRSQLLMQFRTEFERSFFSKFFRHFINLQQRYFDRHKREDFINRFQENLKIRQSLAPAVVQSLLDFLFSFILLGVLIYYHTALGLMACGFFVVFLVFTILVNPTMRRLNEQSFTENLKSMGLFVDTLLGIQSARLLGVQYLKYHKWRNQYTKALNKELKTANSFIQYSSIYGAVSLTGQALIYWYGAYLTFNEVLTIGAYIAFTAIFMKVFDYLGNIVTLQYQLVNLNVSFQKLNDVFSQPTVDQEERVLHLPAEPLGIEIRDLSFRYQQNQMHLTLDRVSLQIAPGQFVGIVGRNGSGKSTLIKIISRLYDHYEGSITINGVDHLQINEGILRKRVAVIPQEVYAFDGTLRENILYGNIEATEEQLFDALEKADLLEFVKSQYLGLNLKIGENGIKLSGGEQLKLAFARLFVSNPELIILDEASSALDVETEQKIMGHIRTHFQGKTIISIAHRLHTLRDADQIIVLDKGKLMEQGKHEDLMASQQLYYQFIKTYVNF